MNVFRTESVASTLLRFLFNLTVVKQFLFILLTFFVLPAFSQSNFRIYAERRGSTTTLYADNNEVAPVSIWLTLNLDNLTAREDPERTYLLPPSSRHTKLVEMTSITRDRTSYSFNYSAVFGDVRQGNFDNDYVYDLPYETGASWKIVQGYNGSFSHQGENSLDFDMPEGSEVHAAREGVVIAVVQNFNGNCWSEECKKMANYVLIMHPDGTIADYSHLLNNGAKVSVGETVQRGQLIALSGNTGFSRGPHLHFDCYLPGFEGKRTLVTRFRTGTGSSNTVLAQNKSYRKNYS